MKISPLILMGLSMLLVGCLSPVETPPLSTYTLIPNATPLARSSTQVKASMLVATTHAEPGYTTSKMMYVLIPYKLKAYADNAWASPPSAMFSPLVASSLRDMNYFKTVMNGPFAGSTDYILYTTIEVLQQEFMQPVSQVRLKVFASILDVKTNQVIASQDFIQRAPAPGNDPYSGVLATNAVANTMADRIAVFAKKAVQKVS